MVRAQAASAPPAAAASIDLLKRAAADGSVPPPAVFSALRALEQAKVAPLPEWGPIIGGTASPGHRWRLVFTSGTKQVQDALKGGGGKGGGAYFPLTGAHRIERGSVLQVAWDGSAAAAAAAQVPAAAAAAAAAHRPRTGSCAAACQRWDASRNEIENGVFLGRLAALTFQGPYKLDGKVRGAGGRGASCSRWPGEAGRRSVAASREALPHGSLPPRTLPPRPHSRPHPLPPPTHTPHPHTDPGL